VRQLGDAHVHDRNHVDVNGHKVASVSRLFASSLNDRSFFIDCENLLSIHQLLLIYNGCQEQGIGHAGVDVQQTWKHECRETFQQRHV